MTLGWVIIGWLASASVTGSAEAVFPAEITRMGEQGVGLVAAVAHDSVHVFTAPLRWSAAEWGWTAAAVGSVGLVAVFDRSLLDAAQSKALRPVGEAARVVEPLGRGAANILIAPFFVYGAVADNARASAVAVDLAATSLIGTVLMAQGLKMAVGRSRPKHNKGTYHFEPFSWRQSFPSADASRAFGLAAVLTEHYSSAWFEVPAYATAGLVAFGRVRKNSHFPSDVVAGSLIGYAVGKSVTRFNSFKRLQVAVLTGKAPGVQLVWWVGR